MPLRLRIFAPYRWAMHPMTATISRLPAERRWASTPRREKTFSSACSRTEQVLYKTASAAAGSSTIACPAARSRAVISSLSSRFI